LKTTIQICAKFFQDLGEPALKNTVPGFQTLANANFILFCYKEGCCYQRRFERNPLLHKVPRWRSFLIYMRHFFCPLYCNHTVHSFVLYKPAF